MDFQPVILTTDDGSHTLRHPVSGDTYHSMRGAAGEAEHVFIHAGFDRIEGPHVRVFEVGFGSGLNAFLTWKRAGEQRKTVDYRSIELYPIAPEMAAQLNYPAAGNPAESRVFRQMHESPWGMPVRVDERFRLTKLKKSLAKSEFDTIFDVIYFDAFAPDTQPELWTTEVFQRLFQHTAPGGILVTYSAKGEVKRALRAAGYVVERLPGALGKRHMLRATNI